MNRFFTILLYVLCAISINVHAMHNAPQLLSTEQLQPQPVMQHVQPAQQSWYDQATSFYNRAAHSIASTFSSTSPQANPQQNQSWTSSATSTVSSFAKQNPWLMATILSTIGLSAYLGLQRMIYKAKAANIAAGNAPELAFSIPHPYVYVPDEKVGLCPGVRAEILGKLPDVLRMTKFASREEKNCPTCRQSHIVSITKTEQTGPLTVSVTTGKKGTLAPVGLGQQVLPASGLPRHMGQKQTYHPMRSMFTPYSTTEPDYAD